MIKLLNCKTNFNQNVICPIYRGANQSDLNNLLDAIDKVAVFIDVKSTVNACRDKNDDFLLSLAKDGNATHLLTGDKDLLALTQFEKTFILTISDYLKSKSSP